jgi:RHS repeat-associated protein
MHAPRRVRFFFGYDPLGRLTTVSRGDETGYHAARASFGPSGQIKSLDLLLPDTNHSPERISYGYDSAQRLRAVNFQDTTGTTKIWRSSGTDVFGRVLKAQLGNGAIEQYVYRADRRRELQSKRTDVGTHSRQVVFEGYDGAMLLKRKLETNSLTGSPSVATTYQYDARNALARAVVQSSSGPVADTGYAYDGLGDLRAIVDNITATTVEIRPDATDPDRICTIGAPGSPTSPCNYRYDATGNVWQIHDSATLFSYDAVDRLRSAEQGGRRTQIDYDPFGSIASLKARTNSIERREQIYGRTSASVGFFDTGGNPIYVGDPGATFQNFTERHIVSPIGTLAVVRHANSGQPVTLYPIGDYQGARTVIGSGPNPTETISYTPYGTVTADSASPNSLAWWPYQWNDGHVLDGFGLVALGQRVLDPRTGRFLQRDPLMRATTAGAANPYAFAWNNPVKFIDQNGAEPTADQGGTVAAGPKTREGRELKELMLEHLDEPPSDSLNWDNLAKSAAANRISFDDMLELVSSDKAEYRPKHGINSLFNLVGSIGAGLGDTITFNLTSHLRGNSHSVKKDSGGYVFGSLLSLAIPFGEIADFGKAVFARGSGATERTALRVLSNAQLRCISGGCPVAPQLFQNQLPERLASELATAARVGAAPIRPGTAAFEAAVNQGTIKFVVTESGELLVSPHTVAGVEISHAVLSGGSPVLAAGQAEIAASGGQFFGISITNYSGHFMPNDQSLDIARAAFAAAGIVFE